MQPDAATVHALAALLLQGSSQSLQTGLKIPLKLNPDTAWEMAGPPPLDAELALVSIIKHDLHGDPRINPEIISLTLKHMTRDF